MAHYEYTRTYNFSAAADIPYRYVCCKCGKEVSGKANVKEELQAKDTARHVSDLGITSAYADSVQKEVVDNLRSRLENERREVESGRFGMLKQYSKCPHCGATQRWSVSLGSAIAFAVLTLCCLALVILCVVICVKKSDKSFLLIALLPLLFGAAFAARTVMDWKGILAGSSRSQQKPEVFFDRMTSPWIDSLKD